MTGPFVTRRSRVRGGDVFRHSIPVGSAAESYLAFAMQTAEGAVETEPARFRFLRYLDGTDAQVEHQTDELPRVGDELDAGLAYQRSQVGKIHLSANLRPEIAGQLFQLAPGSATFAATQIADAFTMRTSRVRGGDRLRADVPSPGPDMHTFVAQGPSAPYATVQLPRLRRYGVAPALIGEYGDAVVNGWQVTCEAGQPVALTADLTAYRTGASAALITPTYYANDVPLFLAGASVIVNGTTAPGLIGFTIGYQRDFDEIELADTRFPVPKGRTIRLEYTRTYEDAALWKSIHSLSPGQPTSAVATGSFDVYLWYGVATVSATGIDSSLFPGDSLFPADDLFPGDELFAGLGAPGELRSIRFSLPLVRYDADRLTDLNPDGKTVMETVSALALRGATYPLVIEVGNGHASPYA